jgi:hypothetical protein
MLGLALWEYNHRHPSEVKELTSVGAVFVFVFGSYLMGHVLGTLSAAWNFILWRKFVIEWVLGWMPGLDPQFRVELSTLRPAFCELYKRIDIIANHDGHGGTILKKMEAGAALSDNLFSAFIVFVAFRSMGIVTFGTFNNWAQIVGTILVGAVLAASVLLRRAVLIGREDALWQLHFGDPKSLPQPKAAGNPAAVPS